MPVSLEEGLTYGQSALAHQAGSPKPGHIRLFHLNAAGNPGLVKVNLIQMLFQKRGNMPSIQMHKGEFFQGIVPAGQGNSPAWKVLSAVSYQHGFVVFGEKSKIIGSVDQKVRPVVIFQAFNIIPGTERSPAFS